MGYQSPDVIREFHILVYAALPTVVHTALGTLQAPVNQVLPPGIQGVVNHEGLCGVGVAEHLTRGGLVTERLGSSGVDVPDRTYEARISLCGL